MSLVVADATDDGPRIVSDTRISFPEGPRVNFKTDALKAIVITCEITICFAGDVVLGLDGVREFAREIRKGRPIDDLLARLQELASQIRRSVEFIVATGTSRSQLIRFRKSGIEHRLLTAWIGDQDGFERFQRERNTPPDTTTARLESTLSPAVRVMAILRRSMQAVIDDPAIASVGDFSVAVGYKATGFEYLGSTFIHVGRDIQIKSGDNLIGKMAQPVEEGRICGFGG